MFNKEVINYNNKLYIIYRKLKSDHIKEKYVQEIKNYWLCDMVVRHNNQNGQYFLFLREISEAELVD